MPHATLALMLGLIASSCASVTPEMMTQKSLAKNIEEIAERTESSANVVQFESAIRQVSASSRNFGSSFSSD